MGYVVLEVSNTNAFDAIALQVASTNNVALRVFRSVTAAIERYARKS